MKKVTYTFKVHSFIQNFSADTDDHKGTAVIGLWRLMYATVHDTDILPGQEQY